MTKSTARQVIVSMGTAARINRLKAAAYFIEYPDEITNLIDLVFDIDFKLHHKAAWVLEFVLENHIDWLVPHLDTFTKQLAKLKNDSALRPIAKICQWIAYEYVYKKNKSFTNSLTNKQINLIIESSFDWMIGEYRVATKVYTMDTLYYFGCLNLNDLSWVHSELKNIILQHIHLGSAGYQSHGKKIITLLDKK